MTSFLNNAANDDDIQNGTGLAKKLGIKVTLPKWGLSHSDYYFTKEKNVIAKGLNSIKYMSAKLADEMSALYGNTYEHFIDLLAALDAYTSIDTRQLDILIKLDFFSDFGNQRELLRITEFFYGMFKCGEAKQLRKTDIDGTQLEPIVCHKDNDKSNPNLSNLKWGTASSNTREAFADGLIKNDKGHDDSQSIPVCCFDSTTKEFLCCYGSVSEAHRATGITKTGILNQCNNRPAKGFRKGFIFRYMSDYPDNIFVL